MCRETDSALSVTIALAGCFPSTKVQYVLPPRGQYVPPLRGHRPLGAPSAHKNEESACIEAACCNAAARRPVQYADNDFSAALCGLHDVAEPKPALCRMRACSHNSRKVDPGPAETPISKKMQRLLKDLRTVDATMHGLQIDLDYALASNHTAQYQDGADPLAITSQLCVPSLALTRKAAHSSHIGCRGIYQRSSAHRSLPTLFCLRVVHDA